MKSRDKFVKQVAINIQRNHASEIDSSFIFGISGKWGEGKTTFLHELESELCKDNEYRVVWVSPWKYGNDNVALLRNFLLAIKPDIQFNKFFKDFFTKIFKPNEDDKRTLSQITSSYNLFGDFKLIFRKVRRLINDKIFSDQLLYDKNKTSLHWGIVILYLILITDAVVLYFVIRSQYNICPLCFDKFVTPIINFYEENKEFFKIVFISTTIPTIYALAKSLLTTQTSTKAVNTIDQFDSLLDQAIADELDKKVVVFVDDLDRVTPEVARNVLDNLRVFFNRSSLSFVVAGDHTVLERYIGKQTMSHGNPNEQLEEGRRYLKKIFNVYWRLPLPIKSEFLSALEILLGKNGRKDKLNSIFSKEDEFKQFSSYLINYFDRNFRAIERFTENVIFTFEVIDIQLEDADDDWKQYLQDLKKFPLLVVRVLLIQEFCAPLFESIVREIDILDQLELTSHKKDRNKFDQKINEKGEELTESQKLIMARVFFDSQGFYDERGVFLVNAYQPFIFLAADTSFGDLRGPLPEEFITILNSGDSKRVANAIIDGGEQKLKEAAANSVKDISGLVENTPQFVVRLQTLINALNTISTEHRSQEIFQTYLLEIPLETIFLKITPQKDRIDLYLLLWDWLNQLKSIDSKWLEKFPFVNSNDFELVLKDEDKKYGTFTSQMLGKWFCKQYPNNKTEALRQIDKHLSKVDTDPFNTQILSIKEILADDFVSETSLPSKNIKLKIVEGLAENDIKQKVINHIYSIIDTQNEALSDWAISVVNDKTTALWSNEDIENRIISLVTNCSSVTELIKLLTYSRAKIVSKKVDFWTKVLDEKGEEMLETVPHIHSDENFRSFALPEENAIKFFKIIVDRIHSEVNIDQKLDWINFLNKQKWFWNNLLTMPEGSRLAGMKNNKDDRIKQKISEIQGSWKGS